MANSASDRTWTKKVKRGFFEIVSVIVGILLALAINEWWEDREIAERTRSLSNNLNVEITENHQRLVIAHEHHEDQLQSIRAGYGEKETVTEAEAQQIFQTLYSKGIFKRARLTEINWEIAKFTGLMSYMPIEDLRVYAGLFAVQDLHENHWGQVDQSQALAEFETKTAVARIDFLHSTLTDVWWIEKNLIAEMEKSLAALEEEENG